MIFASETAQASGGGMGVMLIWIVALVALMYFMMIRPQKKEQKRMQAMLSDLAVVTNSGFYGIVIDISEEDVIVEFGNNKNCRIPMRKSAIAAVEKPEQAAAAAEKDSKKETKTEKVEAKKK